MQNYKVALQKLTLALTSLALLAGCIKPQKKSAADLEAEGADNSATFYAKAVTGTVLSGQSKGAWSLPTEATFNLWVCLADKRTQDDIRLGKFVINGGDTPVHVRSDNTGCVNWSETVQFAYLSQPYYIELKRVLRSEGLQTGSRVLHIALNPWASDSTNSVNPTSAVTDLTKSSLPNDGRVLSNDDAKLALKGLAKDGTSLKRPMIVKNLSINTIDLHNSATGRSVKTQVVVDAGVRVSDTQGTKHALMFTSGRALIEMKWLQVNAAGKKEILGQAQTSRPVEMNDNGSFSVELPMQVANPETQSNVEFAMKITPVDAPASLGAFEGVFAVGDNLNWLGSHQPKPEANLSKADAQDFSISTYVAGANRAQNSGQAYALDHVQATDLHISSTNAGLRVIGLTAKTCLRDSSSRSPLPGLRLSVSTTKTQVRAVTTDATGCFGWPETIAYNPYQVGQPYQASITIKAENGFKQSVTVRLDPWAYDKNSSQVFVDALDLGGATAPGDGASHAARSSGEIAAPARVNANQAQVRLNGYTISENGRYYKSDSHLLLSSTQNVTMDLDASIVLPADRISGQSSTLPLNDGIYLVRVAVRLPPLGPLVNEEIGWQQQLVRASAGRMRAMNFQFDVSDARAYGARSLLYVEISPVDAARVGSMTLAAALAKYPSFGQLAPRSKPWAPRLFVAGYVAGGGQQFTSFQAMDELVSGQAMDSSAVAINNSNLSFSQGKLFTDDVIALEKQYTSFDQLRRQSDAIRAQRRQNVLELEKTSRMTADLNAYAFDVADAKNSKFLTDSGLGTVGVGSIFKRGQLTRADVGTLCAVWTQRLLIDTLKKANLPSDRIDRAHLSDECQRIMGNSTSINFLNASLDTKNVNPFSIDRRLKIVESLPTAQVVGTNQQMTLMVGNSFQAVYSKANTAAWSVGTEVSVGAGVHLGFVEAEAGVKTSASRTQSSSASVNNMQMVTAMSPLTVTKQTLLLRIKKYRPCVVISSSEKFNESIAWQLKHIGLTENQAVDVVSKKLMLCQGVVEMPSGRNLALPENYYIVSTPIIDAKNEDGNQQNSHVWGSVIRGDGDFANFLQMARGSGERSDVAQTLGMEIPSFIQTHATMAMGHPAYYVVPPSMRLP